MEKPSRYVTKHLEVRKKYQEYLLWLFPKISNFPKKQKFLLGERIGSTALDVLEILIVLQYLSKSDKVTHMNQLNLRLETLRELMRLAHGMKFLSGKSFLWQEERINEVGRMAYGLSRASGGVRRG